MDILDTLGEFGLDPRELAKRLDPRRLVDPTAQMPPGGRPVAYGQPTTPPTFPVGPQSQPGPVGRTAAPADAGNGQPGKVAAPPTAPPGPAQQRLATDTAAGAPQLHGWKNVLDVAGKFLAPRLEEAVPGTPGNYYERIGKEAAMAKEEQGIGKTAADIADVQSQTRLREEQARLDATKEGPKEDKKIDDYVDSTGRKVDVMVRPDGTRYEVKSEGTVRPEAAQQPTAEERFVSQYLQDKKLPPTIENTEAARKAWANSGQPDQRTEQPQRQLVTVPVDPNDPSKGSKVIEATPGTVIPKGGETISEFGKGQTPTPDEQRRAELAENLTHNLDVLEDIVSRRPDLFGKLSGRETQLRGWLGTNDADIASLKTLKEQIGIAQISAHGMRNGQQIENAAQSIINGYVNGPDAIKAAIAAARNSVKTFTQDLAAHGGTTGATAAPKTYSQSDVDAAAQQYKMTPEQIEAGFKAKGYTKK